MAQPRGRRRNGLQWPWHPLQVLSWFCFPLLIVSFLLLKAAHLATIANYVSAIVFLFISFVVISAYLYLSIRDPSPYKRPLVDPTAASSSASTPPAPAPPQGAEDLLYCRICQAWVTSKSKHCKVCDKCVPHFDHHCIWLNTCIGESNYKAFLLLIFSATFMTLVDLGFAVYCLFASGFNTEGLRGRVSRWVPLPLYYVALGITTACDVPAIYLLSQLVLFHINVRLVGGKTTYQHIMETRRKRVQQKELMESQNLSPPSGIIQKFKHTSRKKCCNGDGGPCTYCCDTFCSCGCSDTCACCRDCCCECCHCGASSNCCCGVAAAGGGGGGGGGTGDGGGGGIVGRPKEVCPEDAIEKRASSSPAPTTTTTPTTVEAAELPQQPPPPHSPVTEQPTTVADITCSAATASTPAASGSRRLLLPAIQPKPTTTTLVDSATMTATTESTTQLPNMPDHVNNGDSTEEEDGEESNSNDGDDNSGVKLRKLMADTKGGPPETPHVEPLAPLPLPPSTTPPPPQPTLSDVSLHPSHDHSPQSTL